MRLVNSLYARLFGVIALITAAILALLTSMVFLNVLIRYIGIFQGAMSWVDEFSRYLSIWLVFLGSALALDARQHVAADFLLGIVPARARPWVNLLVEASVLTFLAVITREGWALAERTMRQVSPAMGWPMGLVYLAIPTGGVLMMIVSLKRIAEAIRAPSAPVDASGTAPPEGSPR
jgi:TRAP-type C4-dicarboxylate transport system permease small subunit